MAVKDLYILCIFTRGKRWSG